MTIEFASRLRNIPVYPAADGYALPEDIALLASNESPDPPLPEVLAAAQRALATANRYPDPSKFVIDAKTANCNPSAGCGAIFGGATCPPVPPSTDFSYAVSGDRLPSSATTGVVSVTVSLR